MEVSGSKCVVNCGRSTYKISMCFDDCRFSTECEESQDNAVLSQGTNDRDQRFQTQTKPADTGSVAVEMSFSSEKVLRVRIIAREKRLLPRESSYTKNSKAVTVVL